jgi:hypothetical protein
MTTSAIRSRQCIDIAAIAVEKRRKFLTELNASHVEKQSGLWLIKTG